MLSISSSRLIVLPTLSFTFLVSLPMESKNTVPFIYFFICSGGVCLIVCFVFFLNQTNHNKPSQFHVMVQNKGNINF